MRELLSFQYHMVLKIWNQGLIGVHMGLAGIFCLAWQDKRMTEFPVYLKSINQSQNKMNFFNR